MASDPYAQPEATMRPDPKRGLRTRITWFATGVVVSWLLWAVIGYVRDRPRDHSPSWSEESPELTIEWLKRSRARTLPPFTLIASADPSHAAAMVRMGPDEFPGVTYEDQNSDGVPDSVMVADASGRHWSFNDENGDGHFEGYWYSTGTHIGSAMFTDADLDGAYDQRIGPGRDFAVKLGPEWHDVIIDDTKRYVEIDGEQHEIALADDGTWEVVD